MAKTFKIWLEIEEYDDETEEHDSHVAEPEPLEVEFDTLEEAESYRTLMLEVHDSLASYIIRQYTGMYRQFTQLKDEFEKLKDEVAWEAEDHEQGSTCPGESSPTDSSGDLGEGSGSAAGSDQDTEGRGAETEGAGLSGAAGSDPEAELIRRELDFLDAQAEDYPGTPQD